MDGETEWYVTRWEVKDLEERPFVEMALLVVVVVLVAGTEPAKCRLCT